MSKVLSKYKSDLLPVAVVSSISLVWCFWLLPAEFLDPTSTSWVFNMALSIRDNAGGAIGSMLFMVDEWRWPLGVFNNIAQPLGSNLINWAATPWLAVLMKIIYSLGVIEVPIQTVGLQLLFGWSLTALALYILLRRLSSSPLIAGVFSACSLPLVALTGQFNNHALSMQFLVIIPILLVLWRNFGWKKFAVAWPILFSILIGTNAYFFIIALPFFAADTFISSLSKDPLVVNRLTFLIKRSIPGITVSLISLYSFGAFSQGSSGFGTDASIVNIYSAGVLGLFDGDWLNIPPASSDPGLLSFVGAVYIGFAISCLVIYYIAYRWFSSRSFFPADSRITLAFTIALLLFVVSWGSVWRIIGTFSIPIPVPEFVLQAESSFRAIGRFAWPIMYLAFALGAKAVPIIASRSGAFLTRFFRIKSVSKIPTALVTYFLLSATLFASFSESRLGVLGIRNELQLSVTKPQALPITWTNGLSGVDEIEVIPAFDGDANGLPWRPIARELVLRDLRMDTWGFLARYSPTRAASIQAEHFDKFITCHTDPRTFYVVRKTIVFEVAKNCKLDLDQHFDLGDWVGVRFK